MKMPELTAIVQAVQKGRSYWLEIGKRITSKYDR